MFRGGSHLDVLDGGMRFRMMRSADVKMFTKRPLMYVLVIDLEGATIESDANVKTWRLPLLNSIGWKDAYPYRRAFGHENRKRMAPCHQAHSTGPGHRYQRWTSAICMVRLPVESGCSVESSSDVNWLLSLQRLILDSTEST